MALRDVTGKAGDFLTKTAKIGDGDTHMQRLEKIKPLVDAAKESGTGADTYLARQGFNKDETRALVEQVEDLGIIKQRIARAKSISGEQAMRASDKFLNNERIGVKRKQNATEAGQKLLIGREAETIELAKKNAELQMKEDGNIGGFGNRVAEFAGDLFGLAPALGFEKEIERKKATRSRENLMAEAERVGIPRDVAAEKLGYKKIMAPTGDQELTTNAEGKKEYRPVYKDTGMEVHSTLDEGDQRRRFDKLAREVERLGGNPYGESPDLSAKLGGMARDQRETNRLGKERERVNRPGPERTGANPPIPNPAQAAGQNVKPGMDILAKLTEETNQLLRALVGKVAPGQGQGVLARNSPGLPPMRAAAAPKRP